MTVIMKMTAFWDTAPCSLIRAILIALMMEAVCTSNMWVCSYKTIKVKQSLYTPWRGLGGEEV
jgi:hypothetical protein